MTSKEKSAGNDEKIDLFQNQIIYLSEECNSRNQLISVILETFLKAIYPN